MEFGGDNLGTIFLDVLLDTSSIPAQINNLQNDPRIKTNPVKVTVDSTQLHELNKTLDSKNEHLRRTIENFRSNPIVPRVELSQLHDLNKLLDRVGASKAISVSIGIDSGRLSDLEKSLEGIRGHHEVNIKLPDTIGGLTKEIKQLALSPVTIPIRLAQGSVSSVFAGIFEGLGRELSKSFSKEFAASIDGFLQRKTGQTFASTGKTSGQYVAKNTYLWAEYVARSQGYEGGLSGVGEDFQSARNAIDSIINPRKFRDNIRKAENKLVDYLEKKQAGNDNDAANVVEEILTPLKSNIATAVKKISGIGLRVAAQPYRIRKRAYLANSLREASEQAKTLEIPYYDRQQASEAESINLVMGGIDFNGTRNTAFASRLMGQVMPRGYTVPLTTPFSNTPVAASGNLVDAAMKALLVKMAGGDEDAASKLPVAKLLEIAVSKGFNPDAIRGYAHVKKIREMHPTKPINVMGTSGGSAVAEEIISLAERDGDANVRGLGIGLPFHGLTRTAGRQFMSTIGGLDPLALTAYGSQYSGRSLSLKDLSKLTFNGSGLLAPDRQISTVIPNAGQGHNIGLFSTNQNFQNVASKHLGAFINPDLQGRQGSVNLNPYVQFGHLDQDLNIPRTIKAMFGDRQAKKDIVVGGEYSFYHPANPGWRRDNDFAAMTEETRSKFRSVKGIPKKHADEYIAFLEVMQADLTAFYESKGKIKPTKTLSEAARFYPELRELATSQGLGSDFKGAFVYPKQEHVSPLVVGASSKIQPRQLPEAFPLQLPDKVKEYAVQTLNVVATGAVNVVGKALGAAYGAETALLGKGGANTVNALAAAVGLSQLPGGQALIGGAGAAIGGLAQLPAAALAGQTSEAITQILIQVAGSVPLLKGAIPQASAAIEMALQSGAVNASTTIGQLLAPFAVGAGAVKALSAGANRLPGLDPVANTAIAGATQAQIARLMAVGGTQANKLAGASARLIGGSNTDIIDAEIVEENFPRLIGGGVNRSVALPRANPLANNIGAIDPGDSTAIQAEVARIKAIVQSEKKKILANLKSSDPAQIEQGLIMAGELGIGQSMLKDDLRVLVDKARTARNQLVAENPDIKKKGNIPGYSNLLRSQQTAQAMADDKGAATKPIIDQVRKLENDPSLIAKISPALKQGAIGAGVFGSIIAALTTGAQAATVGGGAVAGGGLLAALSPFLLPALGIGAVGAAGYAGYRSLSTPSSKKFGSINDPGRMQNAIGAIPDPPDPNTDPEITNSIKGKFGGFARMLGSAVVGLIGFQVASMALPVVTEFLKDSIGKAIGSANLNLALKATSNNNTAYNETLAVSQSLSQKLATSELSIRESLSSFQANIVDTPLEGQGNNIISGLQKYGRLLGVDGQRLQLATRAVSQSAGKGQLYSEEVFGQLAESLPGGAVQLAGASGLSVKQLRALLKSGGADAADILSRFGGRLNAIGDAGLQDFENTPQAKLGKFGASVESLQVKLGESTLAPLATGADIASKAIDILSGSLGLLGSIGAASLLKLIANSGLAGVALSGLKGAFDWSNYAQGIQGAKAALMGFATTPIAGFLGQMALLTVAVEAFKSIYADFSGSKAPGKAIADDMEKARDAIEKLTVVTDKLGNKTVSRTRDAFFDSKKDIFDRIEDIYEDSGLAGRNISKVGRRSTNKILKRDVQEIDDAIAKGGEAIKFAQSYNFSESESEKLKLISRELQVLKVRDATATGLDPKELVQLTEQLSKKGQEQSQVQLPIQQQLAALETLQKEYKNIAESPFYTNDDLYKTRVEAARTGLSQIEPLVAKYNKILAETTVETSKTTLSLQEMNYRFGQSQIAIDRTNTEKFTELTDAFSGSLLKGARATAEYDLKLSTLNARIAAGTRAASDARQLLAAPEVAAQVKTLQQGGKYKLPDNLADVTDEQLKNLETEAKVSKQVVAALRSNRDYASQLLKLKQEESSLIDARRTALTEERKATREYYFNTVTESKKLELASIESSRQIQQANLVSKFKVGLSGVSSAVGSYVNTLVDTFAELGNLTKIENERKQKEYDLQVQKVKAKIDYTNRNNASSDSIQGAIPENAQIPARMGNEKLYKQSRNGLIIPVAGATNSRGGGYKEDMGLDIMTPVHTPIVSIGSGKVLYAESGHSRQAAEDSDPKTQGRQYQHSVKVLLDKPVEYNGKSYKYAYYTHMTDLSPEIANKGIRSRGGSKPARIEAGQFIGRSGTAGGGPHLHITLAADEGLKDFLNYQQTNEVFFGNRDTSKNSKSTGLVTVGNSPITSIIPKLPQTPRSIRSSDTSVEKAIPTPSATQKPTAYAPVTATVYFPGEGNIKMEGGKTDIYGKYIDRYSRVAATRTTDISGLGLPYGSVIELRNPKNNKTTKLIVRDRGSLQSGVDIDITPAATNDLGIPADGRNQLEMRVISTPKPISGYNLGSGKGSYQVDNYKVKYTGALGRSILLPGGSDKFEERQPYQGTMPRPMKYIAPATFSPTPGAIPDPTQGDGFPTNESIRQNNLRSYQTQIESLERQRQINDENAKELSSMEIFKANAQLRKAALERRKGLRDERLAKIKEQRELEDNFENLGYKDNPEDKFRLQQLKLRREKEDRLERARFELGSIDEEIKGFKETLATAKATDRSKVDNPQQLQVLDNLIKTIPFSIKDRQDRAKWLNNYIKETDKFYDKYQADILSKYNVGKLEGYDQSRRESTAGAIKVTQQEIQRITEFQKKRPFDLSQGDPLKLQAKIDTQQARLEYQRVDTELTKKARESVNANDYDRQYEIERQQIMNRAEYKKKLENIDKKLAEDILERANKYSDYIIGQRLDLSAKEIEAMQAAIGTSSEQERLTPSFADVNKIQEAAIERQKEDDNYAKNRQTIVNKYGNDRNESARKLFDEESKAEKKRHDQTIAGINYRLRNAIVENDIARRQDTLDRARAISDSGLAVKSAVGSLYGAEGKAYQARLVSAEVERANLQTTLAAELKAIEDFRLKNPTLSDQASFRAKNAQERYDKAIEAQSIQQRRDRDANLFGLRQQVGGGQVEQLTAYSERFGSRGDIYSKETIDKQIALQQLSLARAAKLKELDELALANDGDDKAVEAIRQLREEFEALNKIKLDGIERQFSRFKGILDEANQAGGNLIGKALVGQSNGQDWLNLLSAPFKGITDAATKFLSSEYSKVINNLLGDLVKSMDSEFGNLGNGGTNKSALGKSSSIASLGFAGLSSAFNGLLGVNSRGIDIGSLNAPYGGIFGGAPAKQQGTNLWEQGFKLLPSLLGGLLGFEEGGVILPNQPVGIGDRTLIRVNAGEAVMVPGFVDAMGGEKGIDYLNKMFANTKGFADGGVPLPLPLPSMPANLPMLPSIDREQASPEMGLPVPSDRSPIKLEYTKIGDREYIDREHLESRLNEHDRRQQNRLNEYNRQKDDTMRHSLQYRRQMGLIR